MNRSARLALVLGLGWAVGCGSDAGEPGGASGSGGMAGSGGSTAGTGGGAGSGGNTAGTGGNTAGTGGGMAGSGGMPGTGGDMGGSGGQPAAGIPTPAMPLISSKVPAFASAGEAAAANDGNPGRTWSASAPGWLAYDLGAVPEAQRQEALVAVYGGFTQDFLNPNTGGKKLPIDWTIETSTAAGATPPAAGWTAVATMTANIRSGVHHVVNLKGARWVRINVTKGSDATFQLDLDVHSAPMGATDSWLMMGDSITATTFSRPFSDLPARVQTLKPDYYPAVIPAGIGGTNTTTALAALEQHLAGFPGKFVTLNYGTNDHPNEYKMEQLVQMVIAKGKTPVVPRMPWAVSKEQEGMEMVAMIDAIYAKYPQVARGPDIWTAFKGRTDLVPPNDIHPTAKGTEELKKLWAEAMAKLYK